MQIFDGFAKHEQDEREKSAATLAELEPMLEGTPWKLRWQHTGGGCSAWELYADGDLGTVAVYLTGGEGHDSSARIDETGMLVGAIDNGDGCEFPGLDYVETGPELTPRERALVVCAYLQRAEKAVARITPSIAAAQDAFFAALAKAWPEATSGDLYPHEQIKFEDAAAQAARSWISANVPTRTLSVAVVVDTPASQRVALSDGSWL